MDPAPYSLRELHWMVVEKQFEAWNHTSAIVSAIYNSRQGVKRNQLVSPQKIHPFSKNAPKKRLTREESTRRLNRFVNESESKRAKRVVTKGRKGDHRAEPADGSGGEKTASDSIGDA